MKEGTGVILCRDCVELMREIPEGAVDLIVTDPPYGISYKSNRQGVDRKISISERRDILVRESYFPKIQNDGEVYLDWLPEAFRVLKDGSALYVFCHWTKWSLLSDAVLFAGFHIKNMIILNKSNHGMGDLKGSYAPKYELLLFATKGRHICEFPNGRMNDVWDVPVKFSGARRLHPNEKPKSWIEPCVYNSSKLGDLVLDPMCGSGTTCKVAKELGRNYIGMDISEDYCKIAEESIG